MGLFDTVVCNYLLPGHPPPWVKPTGHAFQTKDLDACLLTFEITPEGRLVQLLDVNGGVVEMDVAYHGDLLFCDGSREEGPDGQEYILWVAYLARFTDGRLTSVRELDQTRLKSKARKPPTP